MIIWSHIGGVEANYMTNRVWEEHLSERDQRVIEAAGYDERGASSWESRGQGERPLVLVIDMQGITVGEDVDIFEAIEESTISMGEVAWDAIDRIVPFLDFARERDVPVIYTRVVPSSYDDTDHPNLDIVDTIAPEEGETVIDKNYASAFYGTDLSSHLVREGADTIFVVGNTTSGCLRATVVDAQQRGYNVVVPQDFVFDRLDLSHATALLEMWMKYADVVEADEARELLDEMSGDDSD